MREALRGLTTRGRSFLAAAVAAAISAWILGENDLLRVAVLLAVLPLLAAWYVGRAQYRMSCLRTLTPRRVPAGSQAQVRLRLQNLSRLPTGTLLLEDQLPYALGRRPRLVLERLNARQASTVAYAVRAEVRGRYQIGPLVVRLSDPFGLCELTRSFPSLDRLTVFPRVTPLPAVRLPGDHSGAGDSRARSVAVHGEDDIATREYRHGDDLRRVHWRSTARVGELMVRREEQPWESRATVILDSRVHAHHGEGPASSFEWAVSAAASMAVHLRSAGYRVRLVSYQVDVAADESTGDGLVLDELAVVRSRRDASLDVLAAQLRKRPGTGLVIGLFGLLTPAEADLLRGLRVRGAAGVAFLIDSSTWLNLPPVARAEADQAHQGALTALLENGWRVVSVAHGARLEALWPTIGQRAPGPAWTAPATGAAR